ncbi:hypothetical protein GJAV_G00046150 [Gymnothorax javanicus]|nr:hypothetical protein GJAV_G00046150 [Gymnothorax javanicus]
MLYFCNDCGLYGISVSGETWIYFYFSFRLDPLKRYMDRERFFRFLLYAAAAFCALHTATGCDGSGCSKKILAGKPTQRAEHLNQFNEMNSLSVDRKHQDAESVVPFVGLTGSAKQSRSCCKNGGTCILGSFCACPKYYTGRSCEYDERIRNCGVIPHGEWVQKGCSYCRCGYGMLHCFPQVFQRDCDDSQEVLWYPSHGTRMQQNTMYLCLCLALLLLVFI